MAVGIYPTNGPEACWYITEHSEAEVVVAENSKQLDKFLTSLPPSGANNNLKVSRRGTVLPHLLLASWGERREEDV